MCCYRVLHGEWGTLLLQASKMLTLCQVFTRRRIERWKFHVPLIGVDQECTLCHCHFPQVGQRSVTRGGHVCPTHLQGRLRGPHSGGQRTFDKPRDALRKAKVRRRRPCCCLRNQDWLSSRASRLSDALYPCEILGIASTFLTSEAREKHFYRITLCVCVRVLHPSLTLQRPERAAQLLASRRRPRLRRPAPAARDTPRTTVACREKMKVASTVQCPSSPPPQQTHAAHTSST